MEELIKKIKEKLNQYNIYKSNTINKEEDIEKLVQINGEELKKLIEENEKELFSYLKNKLQNLTLSQYDLNQKYQNLAKDTLLGKSEEEYTQEASFIRVKSQMNDTDYTETVNFINSLIPFYPKIAELVKDKTLRPIKVGDYQSARGYGFILTSEAEIKEFMEDAKKNKEEIQSIPRIDNVNLQDRNKRTLRLQEIVHQFLRENQGIEILLKNIDVQRMKVSQEGIKELEETLNLKVPSPFPARFEMDILILSQKLEELKLMFQRAEEKKEKKGFRGFFNKFSEIGSENQEEIEEHRHKRGL